LETVSGENSLKANEALLLVRLQRFLFCNSRAMRPHRGHCLDLVPIAQNRCVSSTVQLPIAPICVALAQQINACTDLGKLMGADGRLTVQIVLKWVYGYPIAAFLLSVFLKNIGIDLPLSL